jgi:hypothetical protein
MAAAQFTRPDSRDDVSDPRGECVSASLCSRRLTRAAGRILASTAIATGVDLTTLEGPDPRGSSRAVIEDTRM